MEAKTITLNKDNKTLPYITVDDMANEMNDKILMLENGHDLQLKALNSVTDLVSLQTDYIMMDGTIDKIKQKKVLRFQNKIKSIKKYY